MLFDSPAKTHFYLAIFAQTSRVKVSYISFCSIFRAFKVIKAMSKATAHRIYDTLIQSGGMEVMPIVGASPLSATKEEH